MVKLSNLRPLSEFQRDAETHLERLKKTGDPEILTVNGHAELIVQSAEAYQKLLDQADLAESVAILKERIAAADAGEPGIPADEVFDSIRRELGLEGCE
jgi:PHD/YefM family antitoxin component YafN of YafNO toxin-antitoxin module